MIPQLLALGLAATQTLPAVRTPVGEPVTIDLAGCAVGKIAITSSAPKTRVTGDGKLEITPLEPVRTTLVIVCADGDRREVEVDSTRGGPGSNRVEVGLSEQQLLTFPRFSRIAVGDPAIADVKPTSPTEVLVVGKSEGTTTLIVWTEKGQEKRELHVTLRKAAQLEDALHKLLPDEPLTVTEVNGKRVVEGRVSSVAAMRRLQELVKDDDAVMLMVEVPATAKAQVVDQINAAFQKAGLKDAHAVLVGSRIFLEGNVEEEADARKAALIAESIYGANVEALPQ